MMSMPLSKTYQPSARRPSLTRTSPIAGMVIGAPRWRNAVEVVQMRAVHGIPQGRVFLGCDDLLDFKAHVRHCRYDKLQRRHILFEAGLGNAGRMVDVVWTTYPTNSVPVMSTESLKELFTEQTYRFHGP